MRDSGPEAGSPRGLLSDSQAGSVYGEGTLGKGMIHVPGWVGAGW